MPYLEFPKTVYLGGELGNESQVVANAEKEAAARAQGYAALPANPPPEPAQPGGHAHIPYPKILYRDGDGANAHVDGGTIRVKDAEDEARKGLDGFYALGTKPPSEPPPAAGDETSADAEPDERPKPRRGRPPKGE